MLRVLISGSPRFISFRGDLILSEKNLMRKKPFAFSFLLISFALLFTSCGSKGWLSSFSDAKLQSEKTGKNILMVVSGGADSSSQFKSSVLDSKEFLSEASKKFVLLFINLSADSLKDLSQDELSKVYAENSQIIMDYNITEELTLLLLTGEGYWLKEFPYAEKYQEVQNLIADLTEEDEKVLKIEDYISSIKKADGTEKVRLIDSLFEFTTEHYRAPLVPLYYQIPELDPKNKTGLLGKYELLIAYSKADQILSPETVDQAAHLFTDIAENGHLDNSQKFEAYFTAAYMYPLVGSTNFNMMTELLERAYASNPTDAHVGELNDLLEHVKDLSVIYEASVKESKKQAEEAQGNQESGETKPDAGQ